MKTPEGHVRGIIGTQWGDEGKGKIVGYFAPNYEIIARTAGGPNAGHTIYLDGKQYKFHGLPESGLWPGKLGIIGPGALVDPLKLVDEIKLFNVSDSDLIISNNTNLITPVHILKDEIREATVTRLGSTKSGIAFAAADKAEKTGIQLWQIDEYGDVILENISADLVGLQEECERLGLPSYKPEVIAEKWLETAEKLTFYAGDTLIFTYDALMQGKNILVSGAQSHHLDLNEQPYPYGSSTHTGSGGISVGLPVMPQAIAHVTGVMKFFKSRVGEGPFVTEIFEPNLANRLRGRIGEPGAEFGTTSERPRRVGYLDLPEVRRSIIANGITELAATKLDELINFDGSMFVATKHKTQEETSVSSNVTSELERTVPHYEEVGLWKSDEQDKVKSAKSFFELPKTAKKLVKFIENELGVDIRYIGTGVENSAIIVR